VDLIEVIVPTHNIYYTVILLTFLRDSNFFIKLSSIGNNLQRQNSEAGLLILWPAIAAA